jgi:hypothetical protein
MSNSCYLRLAVLLCAACVRVGSPDPAAAQGFDTVGTRAQGMGGAFVAVADDSTATYWNPAGMASIPIVDLTLGFGRQEQEQSAEDRTPESRGGPLSRSRSSGFAVALPVLGVSYYALRTGLALPRATAPPDIIRDDAEGGFVGGAATMWNLGVSLVQSVGDAVVVGGTARLVRAGAGISSRAVDAASAALDDADDLDIDGETKFDADLGVMAYVGRARLGLTVRNLVAPTWDTGGVPLESGRLVRVGVGWGPEPVHGRRTWTIASDADLTTADGPDGERRAVAVGAERWFLNSRVAIRGGARAQTIGEARPVATGGASVGVWSGLLLEAQITAGGDTVERGWGLGARVTF